MSGDVGTHGTTFGGSPLACALGYHVLGRLSQQSFIDHMAQTSEYLMERLQYLTDWFPEILDPDIRGRGLILGLGFKHHDGANRVVSMARERGVLLLTAGSDTVRLVPSLNIGKAEVDLAVDVIESCLGLFR
jgi:acetylornithine aminotransferase